MTTVDALLDDRLRAFAVFARHTNLTRAAAELNLAQPSLHTKLTRLSDSLGLPLYERSGRDLTLTPEGAALAAFAEEQRRAAEDFVVQLGRSDDRLHLAAGRATLLWVLDDALRRLVGAGTTVTITPAARDEAISLVDGGTADVAAFAYDPPPRHLASQALAPVPQVLLIDRDHPLAGAGTVALADLAGLPLVAPPRGRPHREALERAFASAGIRPLVVSEADGWDLIVHLAALGVGATVVNGCVPPTGHLVAVPVDDLPDVGYWLSWRPQRAAVVRPLLDLVAGDG